MKKLKPKTSYSFIKEDYDFMLELIKCGHVHILSSQVELISLGDQGLSFRDWGNGDDNCKGLQMPSNWFIEGIYKSEQYIKVCFGVEKVNNPTKS